MYGGGALLSLGFIPIRPYHEAGPLALIGLLALLGALLAWWLPWQRWHPYVTLVAVVVPALAILGVASLLLADQFGTVGLFYVVVFVWAGLHYRPAEVAALVPLAAVAYLGSMIATGAQWPAVLDITLLLVVVLVIVGTVIAGRVRQLELARRQIAQDERWREALMLALAHDIRSPLATVQSTLELIENDDVVLSAAERERLTGAAMRQTARIHKLAAGLIDVEQAAAGRLTLHPRRVPVHQALHEAMGHLEATDDVVRVQDAGAATGHGRGQSADFAVYADPARLDQILVNLVSHALHHSPPPVAVNVARHDGMIHIAVRDRCSDADEPAAQQAHFERFSPIDRAPHSVGLGLWAARQLARAHGGDLQHYEMGNPGVWLVLALPDGTGASG